MNGAPIQCRLARVMVVVFVLLTATLSLAWSHYKLMSQDEMYAFQTYSVRSVSDLLQVQRTGPISLELLYPLLSHGAMKMLGTDAFALRLPALLGFLLMQVCLFFFVRNMAGERAGVVAVAFPALTATFRTKKNRQTCVKPQQGRQAQRKRISPLNIFTVPRDSRG